MIGRQIDRSIRKKWWVGCWVVVGRWSLVVVGHRSVGRSGGWVSGGMFTQPTYRRTQAHARGARVCMLFVTVFLQTGNTTATLRNCREMFIIQEYHGRLPSHRQTNRQTANCELTD